MDRLFNYLIPVSRLLQASIFVISGIDKIGHYAGTQGYMEAAGVPGYLLPLVILLELGGGVALAVGFLTRWAALALALFTLVAGLLFHFDLSNQLQSIMFLKNIATAGGLLLLVAVGAGPLSLDNIFSRRR